ncbi:MAG: hypothetical protein E6I60_12165 [Chloroflexi bacterium]|nr:MAG: hypothetical protein E6I60_12165 [Chloroflexota bacterium]
MLRKVAETQRAGKTVTGLLQRRRLWIVATVAACVAAADVVALTVSPSYEATALMVIDQRVTSPSTDLTATISTGQLLAAHYIKMASTRTVLDRVCADAGGPCTYDSLKNQVAMTTVKGTDLLAVKVTDPDPGRAAILANLVAAKVLAEEGIEVANALKPTKSYLDAELDRLGKAMATAKPPLASALQAQYAVVSQRREAVSEQESRIDGGLSLVEAAPVPAEPAYSRSKVYLAAGLVIGVVAALIIALFLDRIDSRIYAVQTLAEASPAPLVLAC